MAFKKEVAEIIEPRDVFVGNPKALVTLEEFGEYESEACAKANEIVKKLLEDYDGQIRFNFRHFPLTNIHQRSLKAGEAAVATAQEGKFWEMHNILFANRRNLGTTSLKLYSKEAGVVSKKFLDDLVNATFGWQVQGDLREGLNRGVKDVPTFFVNGIRVEGKATYEVLSKAIDTAIKNVKNGIKPKPPVVKEIQKPIAEAETKNIAAKKSDAVVVTNHNKAAEKKTENKKPIAKKVVPVPVVKKKVAEKKAPAKKEVVVSKVAKKPSSPKSTIKKVNAATVPAKKVTVKKAAAKASVKKGAEKSAIKSSKTKSVKQRA